MRSRILILDYYYFEFGSITINLSVVKEIVFQEQEKSDSQVASVSSRKHIIVQLKSPALNHKIESIAVEERVHNI